VPVPAALEAVILRAIAKDPSDRFADALSFSRELLVMMGKMCLPLDYVASPSDIALALTEPRARVTAVAVPGKSGARAVDLTTTQGDARVAPAGTPTRPELRIRARMPQVPVSVPEVLLSAAAFAAVAFGVAMWFVH
jgi:hypothetical protein